MDNYEINILRRGGNWKKVKPDDLIIEEIDQEYKNESQLHNQILQNDFASYLTKFDLIITKLETLESEKNKLKEELRKLLHLLCQTFRELQLNFYPKAILKLTLNSFPLHRHSKTLTYLLFNNS